MKREGEVSETDPQTKKRHVEDEDKAEMKHFYFEHGLRKVRPYEFNYKTFAKGRWLDRTIADVFQKEFADRPPAYYKAAILAGHITVNGDAVPLDYTFKNADVLVHRLHRHEPPITDEPLRILQKTPTFLIVNKPSSMPCHPTGRYRLNSMLEILKVHGYDQLHLVNRLDRLTSGVLLLPFKKADAVDLQKKIIDFDVTKEYICRVMGEFPTEEITVDEPILLLDNKMGLNRIDPTGKTAVTVFKRESYNGRTSVVRCWPKTGRTHQIRIHLQHLGHPIVNDPLYHNPIFADAKKRGKDDHFIAHVNEERSIGNATEEDMAKLLALANELKMHRQQEEQGVNRDTALDLRICPDCSFPLPDPQPMDMIMWLHAFRYSCEEWSFESPWPDWAKEDYDDQPTLTWTHTAHERISMARMARERLQKHEASLIPP